MRLVDQTCPLPPSTNSSIPVTKLESSDARKSAALAISPLSHASHRDGGHDPCNGVCRLPIDNRCIGRPRTNNVGTNVTILEIQGPGSDKRTESGLRRALDTEGRRTLDACNRAVEDDRSAIFQQRQGFLHCEQRSLDVDAEELVKMFLSDFAEGSKFSDPGRVRRLMGD